MVTLAKSGVTARTFPDGTVARFGPGIGPTVYLSKTASNGRVINREYGVRANGSLSGPYTQVLVGKTRIRSYPPSEANPALFEPASHGRLVTERQGATQVSLIGKGRMHPAVTYPVTEQSRDERGRYADTTRSQRPN